MPDAWDRQDGETEKAFDAFVEFLDMDKPRTLSKAAVRIGKSESQIRTWSARHKWMNRARLYDAVNTPVLSDGAKEAIGLYQQMIIKDEVTAYERLNDAWDQVMGLVEDDLEKIHEKPLDERMDVLDAIDKLSKVRNQLDKSIRRSLRMPTTFKPVEEQKTEEDGMFLLTVDGPKRMEDGEKGETKG